MKKHFLLFSICLVPALLWAQKRDTVADKIAALPYIECEIPPMLKGSSLYHYVVKNFNKPRDVTGAFNGEVVVSLFIDSLGRLRNMQLIKNQTPDIDKEILRMLGKTEWKPAINNFAHINYTLVLRFKMKNDSTTNVFNVSVYPDYVYHPTDANDDPKNKIFVAVETPPTFPGGMNAFYEYIEKTIVYPEDVRKRHIQGTLYITFVVDTDGSLSDLMVVRSPDEELSLEALRVMKMCPKLIPGMQNGVAVRVQYTMPISFTLTK